MNRIAKILGHIFRITAAVKALQEHADQYTRAKAWKRKYDCLMVILLRAVADGGMVVMNAHLNNALVDFPPVKEEQIPGHFLLDNHFTELPTVKVLLWKGKSNPWGVITPLLGEGLCKSKPKRRSVRTKASKPIRCCSRRSTQH